MMLTKETVTGWFKRANTIACPDCHAKPVLFPDCNGHSSLTEIFKDKCFSCAKEKYENNTKDAKKKDFSERLKEAIETWKRICCFEELNLKFDFNKLEMKESFFINCDLSLSNFQSADISDCIFFNSTIDNAYLSNATMEKACLIGSHFNYALIESANLREVIAGIGKEGIKLVGQVVEECSVENDNWLRKGWDNWLGKGWIDKIKEESETLEQPAYHFEAKESVFSKSDLTGTCFRRCNFSGTALDSSRLQKADFSHSLLNDCSFKNVSLGNTSFSHAQLIRVNFSDSFTSDPAESENYSQSVSPEKKRESSSVQFDNAILTGSILKNCYFLCANLSHVTANQTDFSGTMFGPFSILSGDFSNSRFLYGQFIGSKLGQQSQSDPVILRDCDFTHSFFAVISVYTSDIDAASFVLTRFETYNTHCKDVYEAKHRENDNKSDNHRENLINQLLEHYIKTEKFDENPEAKSANFVLGVPDQKKPNINPAAVNFERANIGRVRIKNILFIAGNFTNASITLARESECFFHSCAFDNGVIGLGGPVVNYQEMKLPSFEASSFSNTLIKDFKSDYSDDPVRHTDSWWIFKSCLFNSTAIKQYENRDDQSGKSECVQASYYKFLSCTFDQTSLHEQFGDSLKDLVIQKCRFVDGQYMGLYAEKENKKRYESENTVFTTIKKIVSKTTAYSMNGLDTSDDIQENVSNIGFAEKQYLWNLFATNFRKLAIPSLESNCLCELKDLDLLSLKQTMEDNPQAPNKRLIARCFAILFFAVFSSAIGAGILSNVVLLKWPAIRSINSEVIIPPIISVFILFIFSVFFYFLRPYHWRPIWSKAIYYYGEKPLRSVNSWLFVIITFALMYCVTGVCARQNLIGLCGQFDILHGGGISIFDAHNGFWAALFESSFNCLYFSVVTFTTLGFGDFQPDKLTKLYSAMEACIGAVMMALFVLSFARRTAAK